MNKAFLAAAIAPLLATLALAQVSLPNNTRRPSDTPPAANPPKQGDKPGAGGGSLPPVITAATLSDDVVEIETVGLSMHVPINCLAVQGAGGDQTNAYQIIPQDQGWVMNIQVHQTSKADATVGEIGEGILSNVQQLVPLIKSDTREMASSKVQILSHITDLKIAGVAAPAERMYLKLPNSGKGQQIRGYTILKPLPTTFVVFELLTPEEHFDSARGMYELAIATAKFVDPAVILKARAEAITAGAAFLSGLTDEKFGKLADNTDHWYRLYKPSPAGGDRDGTEVGYRTVRIWRGRRSEIGAEGSGSSGRDNPEGFIVRTQGRILNRQNPKGLTIIDTECTAFISGDREQEAWITKTAVREDWAPKNTKPSMASEMGARGGRSMNIVQRIPGKADSVIQPKLQGNNYLSQAEVQMLGSLLVQDKAAGELGFYAYRPETTAISLRRDAITHDPARAGAFTITTRVREDKSGPVSIYRADGTLVRTELPDGSLWEPTDPETLLRLWKNKNLPVGGK